MPLVTQYRKHGETIDLNVDSAGHFYAEHEGETYRGNTLAELESQLDAAFLKRKRAVLRPVTVCNVAPNTETKTWGMRREPYTEGIGLVHGSYRGKHGRTSARLLVTDDGTKFQLDGYSRDAVSAPFIARLLTPTEEAEYELIRQGYERAVTAMREFRHRVEADLRAYDSEDK